MDTNNLINIIIAIVSSSALTSLINYIGNYRKNKAEISRIEQTVVSDKIDQASVIVDIAMKLLEDVTEERVRLAAEKDELLKENLKLKKEIKRLKLNT